MRNFLSMKSCLMGTVAAGAILTSFALTPAIAADQKSGDIEEVIVTGSRIARQDYQAVSPIVTITAEQLQFNENTNLVDVLNVMPQLAATSNSTTGSARQNVNLRGLGSTR